MTAEHDLPGARYLQINLHQTGDDMIVLVRNASPEDIAYVMAGLQFIRNNATSAPVVVAVHPSAEPMRHVTRGPVRLDEAHPAFTPGAPAAAFPPLVAVRE